jgi:Spy/CpxP family protein refolding chaperone
MDKQRPGRWFTERRRSKMRTLYTVLTMAAALALTPRLLAQDESEGKATHLQDLNLTEKQWANIEEIRKEGRPKVQQAGKELVALLKEEVEKVREVLTPEQKTQLKALKEDRQAPSPEGLAQRIAHLGELQLTDGEAARIAEIRKQYRPKIVQAQDALEGVLNNKQSKARKDGLKAGKNRPEIIASLNLTDDEKAKVEARANELTTLVREEMAKIRDVLKAEQQEKLPDLRQESLEQVHDRVALAIANLKILNLTDEQKTQIENIRKEFRPKIHKAANKLRAAITEEVEMIVATMQR